MTTVTITFTLRDAKGRLGRTSVNASALTRTPSGDPRRMDETVNDWSDIVADYVPVIEAITRCAIVGVSLTYAVPFTPVRLVPEVDSDVEEVITADVVDDDGIRSVFAIPGASHILLPEVGVLPWSAISTSPGTYPELFDLYELLGNADGSPYENSEQLLNRRGLRVRPLPDGAVRKRFRSS